MRHICLIIAPWARTQDWREKKEISFMVEIQTAHRIDLASTSAMPVAMPIDIIRKRGICEDTLHFHNTGSITVIKRKEKKERKKSPLWCPWSTLLSSYPSGRVHFRSTELSIAWPKLKGLQPITSTIYKNNDQATPRYWNAALSPIPYQTVRKKGGKEKKRPRYL